MTGCILQFGLLAQNDGKEWMNILFIVVVAVFWAIGGLVKATGNKSRKQGAGVSPRQPSDAPKRQNWLQQLAQKAEEIQRSLETAGTTTSPKPPERAAKPSRPPQGRVAARTGRGGRPVLVYERQAPPQPAQRKMPSERAASPPAPEKPSAPLTVEPKPSGLRKKPAVPAEGVTPLTIDYTDPDALKKAILHYEILGKPMALRDPFERASVL